MDDNHMWSTTFESVEQAKVQAKVEIEQERTKQAEIDRINKRDRRQWLQEVLGYGALIIGFLAIAIFFLFSIFQNIDKDREKEIIKEQFKAEQVESCLGIDSPAERQLCVLSLDAEPKVNQ